MRLAYRHLEHPLTTNPNEYVSALLARQAYFFGDANVTLATQVKAENGSRSIEVYQKAPWYKLWRKQVVLEVTSGGQEVALLAHHPSLTQSKLDDLVQFAEQHYRTHLPPAKQHAPREASQKA
ncbi:hypothetical protein HYZ97_01300 [Candidatus Pacearchaeota archaeon]|nr:hypothetical protein [Candidatus Pacearchaeota archaeon]